MCSASVTTLVPCDQLESRTVGLRHKWTPPGAWRMRRQPARNSLASNSYQFIIARYLSCTSPAAKPTISSPSLGFNFSGQSRESHSLDQTYNLLCRTFLLPALVSDPSPLSLFHRSPSLPVRSDRDNTPQCRSTLALRLRLELLIPTSLAQLAPTSVPTIRPARTQDQAALVSSEM